MRGRYKAAGVAVVTAGLLAIAAPAWAWHVNGPSATRTCDSVTVSVDVPDEDWMSGSATLTLTAPAAGSATRSGPGVLEVTVPLDQDAPVGTASGVVTWSDSSETEPVSASYGPAPEDCAPVEEEPPPVEEPPAEEPPAEQPPVDTPEQPKPEEPIHGTATDQRRTPTAAPKPPPVERKRPGTLPFTGAGEQAGMAVGGLVLMVAGIALVRKGATARS